MGKELERDLGLFPIITISLGAMIGSGIFVLPGLGYKLAGPAIIAAYALAGLIVLPSALSKAEMATAMPESGGTYLFIDRSMGPLYGTIAGLGAWFSLVFKSAFALVGLGAYLLLFVNIPSTAVIYVALGLAILLLFVNVIGVKQSGRLQAFVVTLVLSALVIFILDGSTFVSQIRYHPFLKFGVGGLLEATGFVFVSYAGVTKIASVAEEVENPGRNIPIAIIGSVVVMMFVYSFVVFVIVGSAPAEELQTSLTPMALASSAFFGKIGEIIIGIVAVLALLSMANAGILSSTRYPLAMSRDKLAPKMLSKISGRFNTPVYSILFTGAILLFLIAFIDVISLAKLASAFQILVFTFVNIAIIAFRESDLDSYQPEFIAPFYPWVQIFGMIGSMLLLTQMGFLPMMGAAAIILIGILWYLVFGREKTEREGAALNAIRRVTADYSLRQTNALFQSGGKGGILIVNGKNTSMEVNRSLIKIGEAMMTRRGGMMSIVRFEEVPDQIPLSSAIESNSIEDEKFKNEITNLTKDFKFKVDINQIVGHDIKNTVKNYVNTKNLNLVIAEYQSKRFRGELLSHDVDYFMKKLNADIIFVRDSGLSDINRITVIGNKGPYLPLELLISDALGQYYGASIHFLHVIDDDVKEEQRKSIESYHEEIKKLYTSSTTHQILISENWRDICQTAGEGTDLIISSTSAHHILYDVIFGSLPDQLMRDLDCSILLVHQNEPRRHTFLRYVIQKIAH